VSAARARRLAALCWVGSDPDREAGMRGIEGEQVLLRMILSESRTHDHQPLYRKIVDVLRTEGIAGATVLKGIAGSTTR
jgi:hypothetical protein